jgi:hypothetical protein
MGWNRINRRNGAAAKQVEGCFLEISITLTNNLNLNPVDYNLEPPHPIGQHHFKEILCSNFIRSLVSISWILIHVLSLKN